MSDNLDARIEAIIESMEARIRKLEHASLTVEWERLDRFAGQALTGLLAQNSDRSYAGLAQEAYDQASYMLEERKSRVEKVSPR